MTPSVFNRWFSFPLDQHEYETSSSRKDNLPIEQIDIGSIQ